MRIINSGGSIVQIEPLPLFRMCLQWEKEAKWGKPYRNVLDRSDRTSLTRCLSIFCFTSDPLLFCVTWLRTLLCQFCYTDYDKLLELCHKSTRWGSNHKFGFQLTVKILDKKVNAWEPKSPSIVMNHILCIAYLFTIFCFKKEHQVSIEFYTC